MALTVWAAIRCPTCSCSASAPAARPPISRSQNAALHIDANQVEQIANAAVEPFERSGGESPYQVQHDLQGTMQDLVGIVRREDEMQRGAGRDRKVERDALRAPSLQEIANTIPVGTLRLT